MLPTLEKMLVLHSSEVSLSCIAIFLAIIFMKGRRKKKYNLPPSPKGLPFFGIFFDIYDYPAHLAYTKWSETLGGIFTARIMGHNAVILNDVETIKEAMMKCSPKIDSRSNWRYCFIRLLKGLSVMPYSKKWMNTRRRALSILREYGMGKSFLEPVIYAETHALIKNILATQANGEKPVEMKDRIRRTPVNVICKMLFSERYDYDDASLMFILQTMEDLLTYLRTASTHDSLPTLLRPIMKPSLWEFHRKIELLNTFLESKVEGHRKTYRDDEQRDFIDSWFRYQKLELEQTTCENNNIKSENTSPEDTSNEESCSPVSYVLQDILFAGAHSTGFAMNWLIMFLTLNKDIQEEVYEAIMNRVGPQRSASMSDRARLPIVEAVIYETLRVSTLVPLVGHSCTTDVTLSGYTLPKDTEVTYNNWAVNFNEENFPRAKSFLPHRWIKEDGSFDREATGKFFPFGLGKRACAGESLAKMELFLITTTLFQNLEFLMPDDSVPAEQQPEIKYIQSFVLEPKPYVVRVRKRPTFSENA